MNSSIFNTEINNRRAISDLLNSHGYSISSKIKGSLTSILFSLHYPLIYMDRCKLIDFIHEIKTRVLISLDHLYINKKKSFPSKKKVYQEFSNTKSSDISDMMFPILCEYFKINIIIIFKNTYYHVDDYNDNHMTVVLDRIDRHTYRIVTPKDNVVFYPNDLTELYALIKSNYVYNMCQIPLQSIQKYTSGQIIELCNIFGIKTSEYIGGKEKKIKKLILHNNLEQIYKILK